MVAANGLDALTLQKFWDDIALTNLEDDVLKALRLISPNIERVNLLTGRKRRSARIPVVKVAGLNEPVPLKSLGEGMNRIFGIALALVSAKNGILLIDEIESGLHYSIQPNIWRLVFEVARRLNIQVFATTHSWDCITAFQQAAQMHEQDEGVLIRLTEKKGRIVADSFDENDLEIATREEIEVR
jgi:AAA15 family ATPase/GTPase